MASEPMTELGPVTLEKTRMFLVPLAGPQVCVVLPPPLTSSIMSVLDTDTEASSLRPGNYGDPAGQTRELTHLRKCHTSVKKTHQHFQMGRKFPLVLGRQASPKPSLSIIGGM